MTDTRARIVEATSALFMRQGCSATGLKAIAEASDATTGSLYHFFPGGKAELTAEVLRLRVHDEAAYPLVDRWIGRSAQQVERFQQVLAGIRAGGTFDLTTLSVAVRELRNLITTAQPAG